VIADIGVPYEVVEGLEGPYVDLLTPEQLKMLIEPRAAEAHKGDFGRVTVVAGSMGKTGAALLSGMSALRSGAGLVTVATPACCLPIVASMAPEMMTEPLADSEGSVAATVPLVLDADALTLLAEEPGRLVGRDDRDVIITPHPGEMARLAGITPDEVQANRLQVAADFATTHRVYVVLKGHRTVIATPTGRVFINPTGNPGMATAGTGDVLTGMVAAWLAQLLDAEAACRLSVFLHGAAGDLAEAECGQIAMTSTDVLNQLGGAIDALLNRGQADTARS
jgi:NAD(P)H-hydrate epimerase